MEADITDIYYGDEYKIYLRYDRMKLLTAN